MAKHKKTRQENKKMKKKDIIKGLIVSFLFFIVGLCLIADAVLDISMLNRLDNGGLVEYQGTYKMQTEKRGIHSNIVYYFTLPNGDVVMSNGNRSFLDINSEDYPELYFQYESHSNIFFPGRHHAVSIKSVDEEIVFVDAAEMLTETKSGIVLLFVLGIPCLLLALIANPYSVDLFLALFKQVNVWNRNRKKK